MMADFDWVIRKPFRQGNSFAITIPQKFKKTEVVVFICEKNAFMCESVKQKLFKVDIDGRK